MGKKIVTFALIFGLLLSIGQSAPREQSLVWLKSVEKAMEIAKASGKVIFVDIYADWCGPCKRLDQQTFQHKDFKEKAKAFVLLKVNGDENEAFLQKHNVESYPTMLFLNAKGERLSFKEKDEKKDRVVGFRTAADLLEIMKQFVKEEKNY
jgi:thiol:disulfide interchange protein